MRHGDIWGSSGPVARAEGIASAKSPRQEQVEMILNMAEARAAGVECPRGREMRDDGQGMWVSPVRIRRWTSLCGGEGVEGFEQKNDTTSFMHFTCGE